MKYTPDFFFENGEIWEIKGYFRKDAEVKFLAFKEQYSHIDIKLYMRKELRELGIKV